MLHSLAKVFASGGSVWETTGYRFGPRPEEPAKGPAKAAFSQEAFRLELRHAEAGGKGEGTKARSGLTEAEQQQVEDLKKRDAEVRRHEQAHVAAAAGHARGGPKFEYENGPDGKAYAVSGHVSIDTSPIPGNPQATYQKAQAVQRAALAPGNPSGADRSVAAQAASMAYQAQRDQARQGNADPSRGGAPQGSALDLYA